MIKNIPVWLVSLAIAGWVIFTGCAVKPPIDTFDANSPEAALAEIYRRNIAFKKFSADAVIEVSVPTARLNLNSDIRFDRETGWHIEITGPFGISLAVIDSYKDSFNIYTPQTGRMVNGLLREGLNIPEINLWMPGIGSFDDLLLPTTPLSDSLNWNICNSSVGESGELSLSQNTSFTYLADSISINLSYVPLRIYEENYFKNGDRLMTRRFSFGNELDVLPERISIIYKEFQLSVFYRDIDVES